MEFIDNLVKYFSDNIFASTLLAIVSFIIGAVVSSFLEPFGKKLYSFFNPPKVSIKIDFENRGSSYQRLKTVYSSGIFNIPQDVWVTVDDYNYYMIITNTSSIALNNIILNLEHDIKFIIDDEDDEENKIQKEVYIDNLQSGKTVRYIVCNERSLVNDTPIRISIKLKESKKEIIQNKLLKTSLVRISNFSK